MDQNDKPRLLLCASVRTLQGLGPLPGVLIEQQLCELEPCEGDFRPFRIVSGFIAAEHNGPSQVASDAGRIEPRSGQPAEAGQSQTRVSAGPRFPIETAAAGGRSSASALLFCLRKC